jgi:hypothetical protein
LGNYVFLTPNQISELPNPAIDKYLNLITSQHKVQPKFMAWISAPLSIVADNVTSEIPSSFDIDNATGAQLDTLGVSAGISRVLRFQPSGGSSPILDDNNFRLAMKAKIARNQWDGTIPQMYDVWNSLFPDIGLSIVDNQNMTMSALVDGQLDAVAVELVAGGYIIPKPPGVGLTIIGVSSVSEISSIGMKVIEMDFITVTTNTL